MISRIGDAELVALAGYGLAGQPALTRHGWEPRLDLVFGHGLAGLLAAAHRAGCITLEPGAADRLAARLDAEALLAVRLEAELLRLADHLDRWGAVVIKGAVVAHEAYPDPALRPFTDIDLLVPARTRRDALDGLGSLGYERPRPDPCPRFDERVAKATVLLHPAGLAVDLHRTLVTGRLADGIDVDGITSERRVALAGSTPVPAPGWDAQLIGVALHAVVGDGLARAISLRDVAQVASHPGVDPARAIALARAWRVDAPVALGLRAAQDDLGAPLPPALADWVGRRTAATNPVRRARDAAGRGGLSRRLTLARAAVAPTPAFLRWRYGAQPLHALYRRRWHHLRHRSAGASG